LTEFLTTKMLLEKFVEKRGRKGERKRKGKEKEI
jgi:hypothetical protein